MPVVPRLRAVVFLLAASAAAAGDFNVRDYGAKGDGVALDSPAINAAIAASAQQGGGTVVLPPGTYLSFSIRLRSNLTLWIDKGATLLAATPAEGFGAYDPPEPNDWGDRLQYQDFGHSHWQNSLIWGENLENVTLTGAGLIDGSKGLVRNAGYGRAGAAGPNGTVPPEARTGAAVPASAAPSGPEGPGRPPGPPRSPVGLGNKAVGLKNCRGVVIRDLSILLAGHFALLATGVDDLTLENLTVDTNRDGFDLDACRNVRVHNCRVNAPNDDAIVLKTSYALGEVRATEDVTITGCTVSGYDVGTLLDGTRGRTLGRAPDRDGPTGRIKLGTESNGAFRRIRIADCTFERSRGLALESVDGGTIEDVTVTHLTMREITNPPIFLRLGNRARGPAGVAVGRIRRVTISQVTVQEADPRYAAVLIAGLPGHAIEEVALRDIRVESRGGLSMEAVAQQPAALVNPFFLRGTEPGLVGPREPYSVPLREKAYPEPSMFGLLPAGAIYARHVRDLDVTNLTVSFAQPDSRPRVVFEDVTEARLLQVDLAVREVAPAFVLRGVRAFSIARSAGVTDARLEAADEVRF